MHIKCVYYSYDTQTHSFPSKPSHAETLVSMTSNANSRPYVNEYKWS